MLSIRIVAAGACLSIVLLVSGMATGRAMAQSATDVTPGKPLQLLKIVEHSNKTNGKLHRKLLARSSARRAVRVAAKRKTHRHIAAAERKHRHWSAEAASTAPTERVRPTANPAAATETPLTTAAAEPPSLATPTESAPNQVPSQVPSQGPSQGPSEGASKGPSQAPSPASREVVVAGQTVQVASPTDVNAIDLAANDHAAQTNDAAPPSAAASTPPSLREVGNPEQKSDSATAALSRKSKSAVGSTSWILQVLAALGGAVTAGSLAWFLIGSTPQRTYG